MYMIHKDMLMGNKAVFLRESPFPLMMTVAGKASRRMMIGKIRGIRAAVRDNNCSTIRNICSITRSAEVCAVWRKAILRNTEISQDHMTPEIRLHLLTPNCPLYHAPVNEDLHQDHYSSSAAAAVGAAFREPFWSIYWPGGQALTRFVLDHGDDLFPEGTRAVLDLGAGCGAAGIAAKLRGAREVVANDIDPVACVASDMNATLNNIRLTTSSDNLLARPYGTVQGAEHFDVIFVGDLLYDEDISMILEPWLDQALNRGARVYLGDPGRHGITENLRRKLRRLESYTLPENVRRENYGFDSADVWQFIKSLDQT